MFISCRLNPKKKKKTRVLSVSQLRQWNGRRHLLVRAAAISDSDGALRSGGSLGGDASSSLLLEEEGRQSGRRQAASSSLPEEEEEEEAPPSVSWRKAFMYTAVATAATAETCTVVRCRLLGCLPDRSE